LVDLDLKKDIFARRFINIKTRIPKFWHITDFGKGYKNILGFISKWPQTLLKSRSKYGHHKKIHKICISLYFTIETDSKALHVVKYSFLTCTTEQVGQ
jgi:hypothetical protein